MRKLVVFGTLALLLTACGSAAETIAEQAAERSGAGDVDVEFDNDGETVSYDVETEDGSASFQVGSQDLPDGFPIPVPAGGEVVFSASSDMEGSSGYQVNLQYPSDQYEDLVAFYTDEFSSLADTQTFAVTGDNASTTFSSEETGWQVSVMSGPEGVVVLLVATG